MPPALAWHQMLQAVGAKPSLVMQSYALQACWRNCFILCATGPCVSLVNSVSDVWVLSSTVHKRSTSQLQHTPCCAALSWHITLS